MALAVAPRTAPPLHVRWLGRVRYRDALALQHGLHRTPGARPPAPPRAPQGVHARGPGRPVPRARRRRPRSAPSWCRPTGAATSPTTGPASWSATRSSPCPGRGAAPSPTPPAFVHSVEQLVIDALGRAGRRRRPARRVPRGVGRCRRRRAPQDRRHRGPAQPGSLDARLRPQRRPRHGDVPGHRALRHRRPARHLAGARRASTSRWPRSSTWWPAWPPSGGGAVASTAPTSCGARRPTDLAPFSRGEGPGDDTARVPEGLQAAAEEGTSVRLLGRLAEAGVRQGVRRPRAQAGVDAGPVPHHRRLPPAQARRSATSTWSRCARRPAARTSSSAGPTAPPRS